MSNNRQARRDAAKKLQGSSVPPTIENFKNDMSAQAMRIFTQDAKTAHAQKTHDGFDNLISRLGINNDNSLSAGTYEFNPVTRNRLKLEAAYRGSWIVGAVVDSIPEDMTRAGVDVETNDSDNDLKPLYSAMSRLQVWQSFCSMEKWARLYGGAIGVYQIEGQDLSTELDIDTITKDQFKGITVFDRWQLNPIWNDFILDGPQMGLPRMYQIVSDPVSTAPGTTTQANISKDGTAAHEGQTLVHHSRVARSIGIELPYFQAITEMMWGESILERLWDRLISFDNATMSSASLIDRANLRTVSIEDLREIVAAGGDALKGLLAQFEMMRMMQTNEGMTLIDAKDKVDSTPYSFAGLSDMMIQFGQQLSGASGIPLVRLFGQSPAGLSATGESDMRMYYDNINAQQEAKFRNPFETLIRIMWRSVYDEAAPDDLEFSFTPLWQMSATDKANNAKTNTETILGAFEAQAIKKSTMLKELRDSSGDTGIFGNISDEEIEDADAADEDPPPGEFDVGSGAGEDPKAAITGETKPPASLTSTLPSLDARGTTPLQRIARWFARN